MVGKRKQYIKPEEKEFSTIIQLLKRETCTVKKSLYLSGKKHLSRMSKVGYSMYDQFVYLRFLFLSLVFGCRIVT